MIERGSFRPVTNVTWKCWIAPSASFSRIRLTPRI
jgi:hypothetical protein